MIVHVIDTYKALCHRSVDLIFTITGGLSLTSQLTDQIIQETCLISRGAPQVSWFQVLLSPYYLVLILI